MPNFAGDFPTLQGLDAMIPGAAGLHLTSDQVNMMNQVGFVFGHASKTGQISVVAFHSLLGLPVCPSHGIICPGTRLLIPDVLEGDNVWHLSMQVVP